MDKAVFAAGCFWGVEAAFRRLPGVVATRVGYCGGAVAEPSYEAVCTGNTGHAEAVEVTFKPEEISYEALLDLFWTCHDPTQIGRQGPDVGSQYRSAIFFADPAQEKTARAAKAALQAAATARPVATEITPLSAFHEAEDYHQNYIEKRGLASHGLAR